MTDKELAEAVKRAIQQDAKLSSDEYLREMFEDGIIDAKGRVFSENLHKIENLLKRKKFTGVSAFHVGHSPGGAVRLHEKVRDPREAVGPYDAIRKIIQTAPDHEGLWQALEAAGYSAKPRKPSKKKTG
jgi:hypothetical protein